MVELITRVSEINNQGNDELFDRLGVILAESVFLLRDIAGD